MKRMAILIAISLALAGCGGKEKSTEVPTGRIDPGQLQEDKGAIVGILIDDAFRPIPNALVLAQPGGLTYTTTINGEFQFVNIDPGAYKLRADVPGHEATQQTAQVAAGEITEIEVLAQRLVNDSGTTISTEHSVFIPCSFIVAGAGGNYGCIDNSGDSYRPGVDVDYTDIANVTWLVTEAKTSKEGYYSIEVRENDGTVTGGDGYGVGYTDGGDYLKIVMPYGNKSDESRAVWNNDKPLEVVMFYMGENLPLGEYPTPVTNGPVRPGDTGVSYGDRGQIVQTLFIGKPTEDPLTFCVLCE